MRPSHLGSLVLALVIGLLPVPSLGQMSLGPSQVVSQPALDGLYTALRRHAGFSPGVSVDHMVFFRDGTVFWRLPDAGLLDFDTAAARRDFSDFWGRYRLERGALRIVWASGKESVGRLEADGTVVVDDYVYRPRAGGDGLQLAGTYRPGNLEPETAPTITFHTDGRFEDRGVRIVVGLSDVASGRPLVPIDPGSGTYVIAKNSLVLRYLDGRREQLSFYVPEEPTTAPKVLVVHTYNLILVGPE